MLYKLNETEKREYSKVKRITLAAIKWKEKDLQDLISAHINDFIYANDLMTIFNERPMQEEPDILALDKNGDLYILELKRWSSSKENLLQVLRYGQLFGNSSYDELNELYQKYSSSEESLINAHSKYFNAQLKECEFNKRQHFLIVTNGLDQATVEAIQYWKNNGIDIDAIIYWVFDIGGEHYIEFNMYSPIEGYLEYECNCYVLNTNYSNNPENTQEMLREEKAAAYWPGWREKIDRLQKGDLVFLYQSGVGIIAYGYADGNRQMKDADGHKDYEYYMHLNKFVKLKEPMSASTMKKATGMGFSFRTTMFGISEECKECLLKEIKSHHM